MYFSPEFRTQFGETMKLIVLIFLVLELTLIQSSPVTKKVEKRTAIESVKADSSSKAVNLKESSLKFENIKPLIPKFLEPTKTKDEDKNKSKIVKRNDLNPLDNSENDSLNREKKSCHVGGSQPSKICLEIDCGTPEMVVCQEDRLQPQSQLIQVAPTAVQPPPPSVQQIIIPQQQLQPQPAPQLIQVSQPAPQPAPQLIQVSQPAPQPAPQLIHVSQPAPQPAPQLIQVSQPAPPPPRPQVIQVSQPAPQPPPQLIQVSQPAPPPPPRPQVIQVSQPAPQPPPPQVIQVSQPSPPPPPQQIIQVPAPQQTPSVAQCVSVQSSPPAPQQSQVVYLSPSAPQQPQQQILEITSPQMPANPSPILYQLSQPSAPAPQQSSAICFETSSSASSTASSPQIQITSLETPATSSANFQFQPNLYQTQPVRYTSPQIGSQSLSTIQVLPFQTQSSYTQTRPMSWFNTQKIQSGGCSHSLNLQNKPGLQWQQKMPNLMGQCVCNTAQSPVQQLLSSSWGGLINQGSRLVRGQQISADAVESSAQADNNSQSKTVTTNQPNLTPAASST